MVPIRGPMAVLKLLEEVKPTRSRRELVTAVQVQTLRQEVKLTRLDGMKCYLDVGCGRRKCKVVKGMILEMVGKCKVLKGNGMILEKVGKCKVLKGMILEKFCMGNVSPPWSSHVALLKPS